MKSCIDLLYETCDNEKEEKKISLQEKLERGVEDENEVENVSRETKEDDEVENVSRETNEENEKLKKELEILRKELAFLKKEW